MLDVNPRFSKTPLHFWQKVHMWHSNIPLVTSQKLQHPILFFYPDYVFSTPERAHIIAPFWQYVARCTRAGLCAQTARDDCTTEARLRSSRSRCRQTGNCLTDATDDMRWRRWPWWLKRRRPPMSRFAYSQARVPRLSSTPVWHSVYELYRIIAGILHSSVEHRSALP